MTDEIVIASALRTPIGDFQGSLKDLSAPQLGSIVIDAALKRAKMDANQVSSVLMGCVLPAGLGQAPARQAALGANLPAATECATINKVCGSAMYAMMLGVNALKAGSSEVVVAGGMESMSNAPYLLPNARTGYRMGHQTLIDHLFYDGLEDAYSSGTVMGVFAERCAEHYGFSRQDQDAYAIESISRALHAQTAGLFVDEIAPVTLPTRRSETEVIQEDDGPINALPEKVARLKPAFKSDGTVTAANASRLSDGAAACVLLRASTAEQLGTQPLARIVATSTHAQAPEWFTTAPAGAIRAVLQKANWSVNDVDLFEVNEAFAVVAMAAMRDLDIAHEQLNVHGGACVLGHPLGASGARIVVTLINALRHRKLRRGVASLCIGGGEATAIAIELL